MELFKLFGVVELQGGMAVKQLRDLNNLGRQAGVSLKGLAAQAVATAAGFGLWQSVFEPVKRLAKETFVELPMQLEQARVGFETMLGSAEKANTFLKELSTFAEKTPFEFPELVDASKRMLAFGFASEQVIPVLAAVGDAASGLGMGQEGINRIILALGQMQAKAKVSAEEMLQLTEAGVPAWDILAEAMGRSTQEVMKLAEKGLIPADKAIQALIAGMEQRFPNMMQKMADSVPGALATIRESIKLTFGELTGPTYERFRQWLLEVRDGVQQFAKTAKESGLREAFTRLVPALELFIAAGEWIINNWPKIKGALIATLGPLLAYKAVSGIAVQFLTAAQTVRFFTTHLKNMYLGLKAIPGMLGKVRLAFLALTGANPILLAITAVVGALTAAGVYLYKNWDKVRYYGLQAWGTLKKYILEAADALLGAYEKLFGWLPVLGEKIRQARAGLSGLISKEKSITKTRQVEWEAAQEAAANFRKAWAAGLVGKPIPETQASIQESTKAAKDFGFTIEDAGKKVEGTGEKTQKAAEDTRAAWEKTADALTLRLQALRTQHETAAMAAERHGDQVAALRQRLDNLNQQLELQRQIVAAVNQGYQESVRAKGKDAEETLQLAVRLEEAKKAQADIEQQVYETNQAIRAQELELRDLADEITEVEKRYREDLAEAQEEYQRKVAEVNRRLAEDERRLTEQFEAEVDRRARALMDFAGLFDQVTRRDVSGEQLLQNLRDQVRTFDEWQANITALAERGVDQGLIRELREMGPKAAPEIAALVTLTDEQLAEYVALWRQKNQEARAEALSQLEDQRAELRQKLVEIRMEAAAQLEAYRIEWQQKQAEIRRNAEEELNRIEQRYRDIAGASTAYGASLVSNFAAGMESRFDYLRRVVDEMLAIVSQVDPTLRHSPSLVDRVNVGVGQLLAAFKRLKTGLDTIQLSGAPIMENLVRMPAVAAATAGNTYSTRTSIGTINFNIYGTDPEEVKELIMDEFYRLGGRT
ncbi:MAG: tape measure protein [Bacillota bacterium]